MIIDPVEAAKFLAEITTTVVAVWATLKKYINGGVIRIETKLDGHIEKVDTSLTDIGNHVTTLKEDVAGVTGYLGIGMPTRNLH